MEVSKAIKERRSIRSYYSRPITPTQVNEVLDAGRYAPSAGNVQDFRFIIVRNEESKKAMADLTGQAWMKQAPVHIIVCSDVKKVKRLHGKLGEEKYCLQNTAACVQNMLLKAHAMGLGTCWVDPIDESEVKEQFKIKEGIRPVVIITLGYPKSEKKEAKRDDLDTLVHYEEWDKRTRPDIGKIPVEKPLKESMKKLKDMLKYSREKIENR